MALQNKHVVIIGNGIAGVTCARHIRKRSDAKITIISGETDHFFSQPFHNVSVLSSSYPN